MYSCFATYAPSSDERTIMLTYVKNKLNQFQTLLVRGKNKVSETFRHLRLKRNEPAKTNTADNDDDHAEMDKIIVQFLGSIGLAIIGASALSMYLYKDKPPYEFDDVATGNKIVVYPETKQVFMNKPDKSYLLADFERNAVCHGVLLPSKSGDPEVAVTGRCIKVYSWSPAQDLQTLENARPYLQKGQKRLLKAQK